MCPLEPISCPAGWQFDAQGHDKQNHGDDNYKWPHACEKCGRGVLIKTTIPLNTPAEKGRDANGSCSQMFVRRALRDDQRLTRQDQKQLSTACHDLS